MLMTNAATTTTIGAAPASSIWIVATCAVVHSLDIAAAVPDIEPPEFSDQLLSEVARVAATAAVLLGRGVELMLALTGRGTLRPGFSIV